MVDREPVGDTLGLAECIRIPVPPLLADHRDSSDDYRWPLTRRLWPLRPSRPSTTRDPDCGARKLRSVRRSATHVVTIAPLIVGIGGSRTSSGTSSRRAGE